MDSILWAARMFISNLVATCRSCCMLTCALCVGVHVAAGSAGTTAGGDVGGQRKKLVGEKLFV